MTLFDDSYESKRRFSRRAALLLGIQTAASAALIGRLYHLQIVDSDSYKAQAEANRVELEPFAASRGKILDRHGQILAENRRRFMIYWQLQADTPPEIIVRRLSKFLKLSSQAQLALIKEMAKATTGQEIEIASGIDWKTFAQINANAPALPGIVARSHLSRFYPAAESTAHITGYIAAVSKADLAADPDVLLRLPEARIGRTGVERLYEQQMRGQAGRQHLEVDAYGRALRELKREPAVPGNDVSISLDLALQNDTIKRCAGQSAGVVVMEVQTGDVLALVSTPSFDPNLFVSGIDTASWQALLEDKRKPLLDKTLLGLYPPGSTFKMVTALAALESGEISAEETVRCHGSMKFGRRHFHCWKRFGHGAMNLREALKQSCDVYFYELAKRVGMEAIADMARRLGLGIEPEGILLNAKSGLIPTPEWKLASGRGRWNGGDTLNAAIGQGMVLTSPLQLAVMTARIAHGSLKIEPQLARSEGKPSNFAPLDIMPEHLQLIREGMFSVVNEQGGTAYASRFQPAADTESLTDFWAMAGKTGTSQVRNISALERRKGVRKNDSLPQHLRDHGLFVAYAPALSPRYAIAVVVEHGGSGSSSAAPIARDVLQQVLKTYTG